MSKGFSVIPVTGIPEILPGDDLSKVILKAIKKGPGLQAFDIVVITSKIISKAEGKIFPSKSRDQAIIEETVRLVAERGKNQNRRNKTRTYHGSRWC